MQYDLEKRVIVFSKSIIQFIKNFKITLLSEPLLKQLIKSSTSVGANYMEANEASSKRDFYNKICISRKEAHETKYWLQLLAEVDPEKINDCRILYKEANELTLILGKIFKSSKKTKKN
jgi:four helix bundle protein